MSLLQISPSLATISKEEKAALNGGYLCYVVLTSTSLIRFV